MYPLNPVDICDSDVGICNKHLPLFMVDPILTRTQFTSIR